MLIEGTVPAEGFSCGSLDLKSWNFVKLKESIWNVVLKLLTQKSACQNTNSTYWVTIFELKIMVPWRMP